MYIKSKFNTIYTKKVDLIYIKSKFNTIYIKKVIKILKDYKNINKL